MNIVCLDMEGVLVPEIWIAFAQESGIPQLSRTTRDEPDYDKLMKWRLGILKEHGLGLREIQAVNRQDRPPARRKGVSGQAPDPDPGDYFKRHLRAVCPAPDGEAELAHHLLQHPGGSGQR